MNISGQFTPVSQVVGEAFDTATPLATWCIVQYTVAHAWPLRATRPSGTSPETQWETKEVRGLTCMKHVWKSRLCGVSKE